MSKKLKEIRFDFLKSTCDLTSKENLEFLKLGVELKKRIRNDKTPHVS